ncbi:TonB-dependent receptor domain-containing protein [Thioalkalivibrio sp. ALJ1]|uniref:TonB-dependent receptor domain-containing protein n=1 Tax=Thioalkalivibrio sp. ALJ1 TaxID=1158144 RepID=UPI00057162D4|nr:TonB-dependent receptor [Thioalkalivibrio sp. ALJ1]
MKRTALSAAILLATTPVLAETPDTDSEAHTLDVVQVTAARFAQTVDESLSSVTVIDREEIERTQPQQFTDLLRGRAGLYVSDNGPFGKTSRVSIRGANSDHSLLLINGVRTASATAGAPSWQFLPPEEIERIEVVRGPRTSIYGSDAIGGVVQVMTREGRKGPPRVNAFVGGGSYGTREIGVGVAGGTEDTTYSVSVSHFETDGVDVLPGYGDDDRDGYENTSLSSRVTHRLGGGAELFGSLLYSEGRTEFDGGAEDEYTDYVQAAIRGGIRFPVTDIWDTELSLSQSRDDNDGYEFGQYRSTFDTRRDLVDWRNDIALGRDTLLITGLDWQKERVDGQDEVLGFDSLDVSSRTNTGVYSVLQTRVGQHDLEGSLRYDDNEQFGSKTTGQVAWGRDITDDLRLRASYGTAFNAPSFNNLYYPGFANPDLQPEESETFELGARYQRSTYYWDAALFQTRFTDLIVNTDTGSGLRPENFSRARAQGLELETGYEDGVWSLRGALTLLDAEDRSTGNELPRRSPVSGRVDLDRRMGDLTLGAGVAAQARSYDDAQNDVRLSGFATVDLRASYALTSEWTLQGTVRNAFDRDYSLGRNFMGIDYDQPGRTVFVKLRYQQR